jgi:ABC-2 type transport system ATP-binding protein
VGGDTAAAATVLSKTVGVQVAVDPEAGRVSAPVRAGAHEVAAVVRGLEEIGVVVVDLAVHRPSLDDVFLALTGRDTAREAPTCPAASGVPAGSATGPTRSASPMPREPRHAGSPGDPAPPDAASRRPGTPARDAGTQGIAERIVLIVLIVLCVRKLR